VAPCETAGDEQQPLFTRHNVAPVDGLGAKTCRQLALRLLGFGAAVHHVAEAAEPHKLASFLFETASAFTTFYEQCPVLQAGDPAVRTSRLALSALTLRVLLAGLGLLGIPVPERM
jgi:arginyl-tRNA synthetase